MGLQSDLEHEIDSWRGDLANVKSALDNALSSVRNVKDKSTADDFSRKFEELKAKAYNFNHGVEYVRDKVQNLRSEMERKGKEEEEAKKKAEEAAKQKKAQEATIKK